MSIYDALIHSFFKLMVQTVLLPIRNQAFAGTRKAKISATEQEALSSGSVGFEAEFLKGSPDWKKLLDMPPPALTEEERAFLNGPVEKLCAMLDDWRIRTEWKDLPPDAWAFMKRHKFFGMIIPKDYDGLGFSAQAHSEVILKLASRSTTATVTAMVPNSLGPAELLIRYGTDEQKNYYLPRLARGEEIPSFALTEPDAGSDASSMTSYGVVCEQDGQLGIRLNWEKRYITLSPIATLLGLAFKLQDPDGLLGGKQDWGITLALIPVSTPGVQIGKRHNPLGIPFHNGPTTGKDVWIPLDQIIGGKEYAGQGWRMLMECLSVGRCISLPALSTGSAKLICRLAGGYSRIRKQFRVAIGQFEGVEELLARMAGTTYMMDGARLVALQMLDRGEHPTILSAILKYHMTEYGRQIVNDGMDIMGGKAICEGPTNLIAPLYHGIPIGITVEGANLLTRNMIIFGQGSVRSHPFILKEIEAARLDDIDEARKAFTDLMAQHVRLTVRNKINSMVYGVLNGHLSAVPKAPKHAQVYFRHVNRLAAAYAITADTFLMLLGDSVKRKERISALLGDVMSYLFLASSTLRHYMAQGCPEDERPLMEWACQTALYQAEESLERLLQNFPISWMGGPFRLVVFPVGRRMRPPSHKLERKVAKILLSPGVLRDRLTAGVFVPHDANEPLGLMELCMEKVYQADAVEARIRQAKRDGQISGASPKALLAEALEKNLISDAEAGLLQQAEALRQKIIRVDDFEMDLGRAPMESLSIADGTTLKNVYPVGTRWEVEIPDLHLVSLMDRAVERFAGQPCIDFLDKKYTYREVGSLIQRIAAGLQAQGVGRGDKIGLYMPNTPYYPLLFFGALKAGATVVNFCPMHTLVELQEQARDSEIRMLVTLDLKDLFGKAQGVLNEGESTLEKLIVCRMEDVLPFFKAQAYRILRSSQIARPDEMKVAPESLLWFKELTAATEQAFEPVEIQPEDVAVLQYTGGTTGTPKGAMLTHANLVGNVMQIEEYFKASADKPDAASLLRVGKERVLASIPYFHIFGMTVSMISSLNMGGELIILPDPRNTRETLKMIHEKKPTLFPAVPRMLQAIAENSKTGGFNLTSLDAVISGGAALSPNVQSGFEGATHKSGIIKQGYGLTETAPVATSNPPYGLNKPESVGLPIPRTRIKITDPDDPNRVLPLGEIGEICINGPQVMKGYYNRPEETAEVLHDGWLRTGDIGYLDEDYYLHIVDRQKRLILVNGFNVYPTQVEHAIAKHPAVAECIVISVPDPRSGEAAKAFVRLREGMAEPPTSEDLKDFLGATLSRIEIPKHLVFVAEEIPKTAVGKPDWKRLQDEERVQILEFKDNDDFPKEQAL
jgi:acyl-CoA dehydrogenase